MEGRVHTFRTKHSLETKYHFLNRKACLSKLQDLHSKEFLFKYSWVPFSQSLRHWDLLASLAYLGIEKCWRISCPDAKFCGRVRFSILLQSVWRHTRFSSPLCRFLFFSSCIFSRRHLRCRHTPWRDYIILLEFRYTYHRELLGSSMNASLY